MKYKCVIFDCDGVLVDSEKISNRVIVDLAKQSGINIDLEYAINEFSGTSLAYVMNYLESKTGIKLPSDFEKNYRKTSFDCFIKEIEPVNGIKDVLEKIKVPMCVASNGPLNKMKLNLEKTNLINYFNGNLYSAYEINSWKPSPTLFLIAAKELGFQPSDCVVIEDSVSGVKAAIAGEFKVFAYAHSQNENKLKKEGAITFKKMSDLFNLLELN